MEYQFANVIVDITHEKLDRIFQYKIPFALREQMVEGVRVEIPFGKGNRSIQGYVIELTNEAQYPPEKMKEILRIVMIQNTSEAKLIGLAAWMKEQYGSTMIQALKTVLPIKQKVKNKEKRTVHLRLTQEEAKEKLALYNRKHNTARARLLEALIIDGDLSFEIITKKLNITTKVIQSLEEQEIISLEKEIVYRNPVQQRERTEELWVLSREQQDVVNDIIREWETSKRPCLIHGITGSGKTQVYMELISQILKDGKQVIVLIPEIALTYQIVMRFYQCFGNKVSFLNSKMSQGERYDQFERAKSGEIQIMVGPRSALFTPFYQLGLIIIDEEHENTYKSETTPRYDAIKTAIQRGYMEQAHIVLGSATPSVESYYKGTMGEYKMLTLKERYGDSELPQVSIVDLREELKAGNRSILSIQLQEEMEERLARNEQIILFLNRRGYAGFISCRECGFVVKCPHCDVSMALHHNGKLVCHYCGHEIPMVSSCPSCGSKYISGFRAGTQQIEEFVKKRFPEAKVLRMDFDTTKKKDDHEKILSAFANQEADVLIGTQMIVKGHDFPNVTLVGVIAADLSLNSGGYRSSERTFQLVTQAVGRAGRGIRKGNAIIQTYQPEHYAIIEASKQDYQGFYNQEIAYRMLMDYPPTAHMTAIFGSGQEETLLIQAMEYIKRYILKLYRKDDLQIIGPAPDSISKINDIYRQVIYLKHEKCDILIRIKNELERYIEINRGFEKIHIQFDFNI